VTGARGFAAVIFAVLLAVTVVLLLRASRRLASTSDFWAAGHAVSARQNGIAMSGDFLGATTMLGSVGLIMLFGFDGALHSLGWLVGFITVLFFVGERLRNVGRYTLADALALRLRERPVRVATAANSLLISTFLMVTQLIAGGVLLGALFGLRYWAGVLITAAGLLGYVLLGGMISVTWLQVAKALALLAITVVTAVWVLAKAGFDPGTLLARAAAASPAGNRYLQPGLYLTSTLNTISLGIALVFGVAGLPHLLMRFFTVPGQKAARESVGWAVAVIGAVYLCTIIIGVGARALLSPAQVTAAGKTGNNAAPTLVSQLGGGPGSWGGELFLALFIAVAFATVLAYVAGLVIAASSAVSHDVVARVIRQGELSDRQEIRIARLTTLVIAALGVGLAMALQAKNIVFLAGLVYAMAASTNFPVLVCALYWRRFSTAGAVAGIVTGAVSAIVLIVLSPGVWPGPRPPVSLANPAIISVPLAFLACALGSLLRPEAAASASFAQFNVRSATGIGAEEVAL